MSVLIQYKAKIFTAHKGHLENSQKTHLGVQFFWADEMLLVLLVLVDRRP